MRFSLDLSHHPWTRAPNPARAAAATLALARAADEGGIDDPAGPRRVAAPSPKTASAAASATPTTANANSPVP